MMFHEGQFFGEGVHWNLQKNMIPSCGVSKQNSLNLEFKNLGTICIMRYFFLNTLSKNHLKIFNVKLILSGIKSLTNYFKANQLR